LNEAHKLLGNRDTEGKFLDKGEQMDMATYMGLVNRMVERGIDRHMITPEMGFPPLAELAFEAKQYIDAYEAIPSHLTEQRDLHRRMYPDTDAFLVLFKGYSPKTAEGESRVQEYMDMFDIAYDAVPYYSMTDEIWKNTKEKLKEREWIQNM
jgi:hypothetical protein